MPSNPWELATNAPQTRGPRSARPGASMPFCPTIEPGNRQGLFSLQGLYPGPWWALASHLLPSVTQS